MASPERVPRRAAVVAVAAVVLPEARARPSERCGVPSVTSSPLLLFAAATRGCGMRHAKHDAHIRSLWFAAARTP